MRRILKNLCSSLLCVGLVGWSAVSAVRADDLPVTDKIPASPTGGTTCEFLRSNVLISLILFLRIVPLLVMREKGGTISSLFGSRVRADAWRRSRSFAGSLCGCSARLA